MTEIRFQSYLEYITHLSLGYPEFGWLRDFLSQPGASPSVTRVLLVDSVKDGHLQTQDFPGPSRTLSEALKHRMEDVQTRILVVSYFQSWNIDREVIDAIGMHYMLDPWFLWGHLDHYYASGDALCLPHVRSTRRVFVEPLRSERTSVEVTCGGAGISALFFNGSSRGGTGNTIVVFARDSKPCTSSLSQFSRNKLRASDFSDLPVYLRRMPSARFNAALKKLTPDEVRSADRTPIDYIYPFARLFAAELNDRVQQLAAKLEDQFTFGAAGQANTEILEGSWAALHDIQIDLSASFKSLSAFTPSESPNAITPLLEDFKDLQQLAEQAQQDLRDYLNRHVGMMSLKESRLGVEASERSITQAKSVNRLTKLAFVFIPLSFASSVFGMNFKELGTGQLNIWIFGVTASLMVVLVALIAFGLTKLPKRRGRAK
ncbi:hypothetical protein FGG08_004842 [Glutinoglossum americanum]|uniref:Uncharacterized protein n=1 Tax=Glutinoglossum americanum TaxID=1670608 RepID=A0A9P8I8C7_9PEZI|nr:hypothetical protein FGG08_004842 [Glutinoglossum americanum]